MRSGANLRNFIDSESRRDISLSLLTQQYPFPGAVPSSSDGRERARPLSYPSLEMF